MSLPGPWAARLAVERERDALRARLSAIVEMPAQAAPAATEPPTIAVVEADTPRRPAGLWGRLRRALGRPCPPRPKPSGARCPRRAAGAAPVKPLGTKGYRAAGGPGTARPALFPGVLNGLTSRGGFGVT